VQQIVITGGNGSLAQAISTLFSNKKSGVDAPSRTDLDVTDPSAIRTFFENRHVDLLICAAGITRDAILAKTSIEDWDQVIAVNFHGAHLCAQAALPAMIARRKGHIIFISSQSAIHPPAGQSAYATAKAALLGLTRDLAHTHGPHGIRINAILPGFMETPMTRSVSPQRRDHILAEHVMANFNTPEIVAAFIHHLHHQLPHTSGQIFRLDSRPNQSPESPESP
jgi:3-oxoacyl-[acyl-carrier protein] reductase